jgi:protein gp37
MADVFEDYPMPKIVEARRRLFELIPLTPHLDWLILTKRPENIEKMAPKELPSNVWLGVSVENQKTYDERVPILLSIPAKVHFISAEPLLEPIMLYHGIKDGLNWLICGGESGRDFRDMSPEWAISLRDQCKGRRVGYFFKQFSGSHPQGNVFLEGKLHQEGPICE